MMSSRWMRIALTICLVLMYSGLPAAQDAAAVFSTRADSTEPQIAPPLSQITQTLPTASFAPDTLAASMVAQVLTGTVYYYDGALSGAWPVVVGGVPYTITTRHTSSGHPIQQATQYVYEHLQNAGLSVSYQYWSSSGYTGRNVIGVLTGTLQPAEIVLVTAHLDDMPASGPAPGADDNASGSVGVMLAAGILSQYEFSRTLRFVWFTGEEQGLLGSKAYAAQVHTAGENIVAVYNMDMIAWDSDNDPTLRLHIRKPTHPGYASDLAIARAFSDTVSTYGITLTPIIDADGESASDHSSFWDRGYAALLAIEDDSSDFNDYYHTAADKLSALNMTYFTNFVKASVGTAAHLAYPLEPKPSLPSLRISKSAFPNPVTAGGQLTYTLYVTNTGSLATGVIISDALPLNTYWSSGGTLALGHVEWSGLTLTTGQSISRTFVVTTAEGCSGALVNANYGASCAEHVTASGAPVSVTVGLYSKHSYLPLVVRE